MPHTRTLSVFDYRSFAQIPTDSGIYAFFPNFARLRRRAPKGPSIEIAHAFGGPQRLRTQSKPRHSSINISGSPKKFAQFIDVSVSHRVSVGTGAPEIARDEYLSLCDLLDRCALLTGPLYVGKARNQTFRDRFAQHQRDYKRYKNSGKYRGLPFDEPGGKLGHRLLRRRLEFRDLLFVCIRLDDDELDHVSLVEKVVHALGNPPLSYAH